MRDSQRLSVKEYKKLRCFFQKENLVDEENEVAYDDLDENVFLHVKEFIDRKLKPHKANKLQALKSAFRNLSEDTVIKKLEGTGVDAVLTIVLLNKTKEKYYVPARVYYSPYIMYHHHFWGYYNTMTARIYSPGYYTYDKKYFWESNLYDMNTKELIYSVQTESFNPNSSEQLAHEYSDLIINNMSKNKVINF